MFPAQNIDVVLSEDGKLSLENLLFRSGQKVKVTVVAAESKTEPDESLRGTLLRYDGPTKPLPVEDWGILN